MHLQVTFILVARAFTSEDALRYRSASLPKSGDNKPTLFPFAQCFDLCFYYTILKKKRKIQLIISKY